MLHQPAWCPALFPALSGRTRPFCCRSGSVARSGYDAYQPDELIALWQTYGVPWVRTQSRVMPAGARGGRGVGLGDEAMQEANCPS